MADETRAADILSRALDIWEEKPTDERPRIPSGVIPTGTRRRSSTPPKWPTSPPKRPIAPPPLPTTLGTLDKRVRDAEQDIVFVIEATSKRLDLVESRQRKFIGVVDGMAARLEALESWAEKIQESLETWGEDLASHTTKRIDSIAARVDEFDDRMHAVNARTAVRMEALSEEIQTGAPPSNDLEQLAGQLDLLLAQMSQWRADHEALAEKLED